MELNEKQIRAIRKVVGYKGRKVKQENFRSGMSLVSYWDEGSKDDYWLVNIDTGHSIKVGTNGGPFQKAAVKLEALEPNFVVAEVSTFLGKTISLTIYS